MIKYSAPIITIILCLLYLWLNISSLQLCIYLSIATAIVSIINIITLYDGRFSLSSAFISYTIATQFGLVIPYFFFGDSAVNEYSDWTLAFLQSAKLPKSIVLGCLAVSAFEVARVFAKRKYIEHNFDTNAVAKSEPLLNSCSKVLLAIVLLFFGYHIATGGMALFGTYEAYMNSRAYNSPLYHYVLILFYLATIYNTSSGAIKDNKFNWFLWFLIVLIFSMNGNKGEFLYALLASFGIQGLLGKRISRRAIILVSLLVFIAIPSITALRSVGIANNLKDIAFNPFGAFAEMGMQIRTTVYSLEEFTNGSLDYLYGQSYWQPIVNILTPLSNHTIATAHIRDMFPGYGFNQVIESYLNFDVIGVMAFFFITGFFLCKCERQASSKYTLALVGSITTVLINASRNYFVFVPGQILIVVVFYYLLIKKRAQNI